MSAVISGAISLGSTRTASLTTGATAQAAAFPGGSEQNAVQTKAEHFANASESDAQTRQGKCALHGDSYRLRNSVFILINN